MTPTTDTPPVVLGELKAWLAITSNAEDAALSELIGAALDICEAFTGRPPLSTDPAAEPMAGEWSALPAAIRHGTIRLAAFLFRQRDGEGDGAVPPASIAALWRPWRRMRLA